MGSLDKLASIHPKENAGASSSNRFEYQINWGLHRLLQLEKAHEVYVMILDYHDDIIICNSEKQEDYIDFYQIKTRKNSNWGIMNLCDKKEKKDGDKEESDESDDKKDDSKQIEKNQNDITSKISIEAKLLQHTKDFDKTRKLYFVTNAPINFIGNKPVCKFSELTTNNKDKIREKIKQQLGNNIDENFEKLIFVQNEMSETKYQETMLGELMNVFRKMMVKEGVKFISPYHIVETTRLHGCILSVLLNKQVTLVNNSYGKNKNFYDTWLVDDNNVNLIF